jgi:hypothetical protein
MSNKSPESLQLFLATLAGLNSTEITKAKELYIKNEITECQAEIKSLKNEYFSMAFHLLIPFFWPMLFGGRKERKIRIEEKKAKINNALLVWKDDLGDSYGELKEILNSLQVSK